MTASTPTPTPTLTLSTLPRASGSATLTYPPTTSKTSTSSLICAVHYPLEAPTRIVSPDRCVVEVNIRPAVGVGGVRERWLEGVVQKVLEGVVMLERVPRAWLECSVQVVGQRGIGQGDSGLRGLDGLVNVVVAACLDAGVPMGETVVAVELVVGRDGVVRVGDREGNGFGSRHVLGFTLNGECVLVESEGRFGVEEWERVEDVGRRAALGKDSREEEMEVDGMEALKGKSMQAVMREAVATRVARDERWKEG